MNKKIFYFILGGVILFSGFGATLTVLAKEQKNDQSVAQKIQALLTQLQRSQDEELAHGTFKDTFLGRVLDGDSKIKMESEHEKTQKEIDALIARPESEREVVFEGIRTFMNDSQLKIVYQYTSKSSYNWNIPVEVYRVGDDQYEIDARNNEIIQFGPGPFQESKPMVIDTTPRYDSKALERMAREFIANKAHVNLSDFTPNHGNKEGINYFFRWEDRTRKVGDMYPFIQVGFSVGGSFLSYTNILGL